MKIACETQIIYRQLSNNLTNKTVKSTLSVGIHPPRKEDGQLFIMLFTPQHKNGINENSITKIPKELGKLKLTELDLSNNNLGENQSNKDWEWITNGSILNSLRSLNLSKNKLSYFPRLNNLKFLHIFSNKLESLPNSLNYIHLDTLDVWNNNFQSQSLDAQITSKAKGYIPPLWEMAARVVESKSLSYNSSTIPSILVDIMSESPLCVCGLLSFSSQIYERSAIISLDHVKHLVFSREQPIYQDCAACSDKCVSKLYSN
ncbi:leucine-rich repeat protein 1-like [Condylostylus longicornis]|uniref:leucine-rich repeat protein 1-like n=1 Tax=Condylostylus longicornis TaxID=2530218 RepID=UPI00244E4FC2|nr:leucine-rich repeat protein 1-like [Condylostylus longicornis]